MGTVEGLSPDTEYVLQLRAHTRVGPGPPASLTVKTSKLFILQYNKKFWLISSIIYHVKSKYCTFYYCLSWATVVVPNRNYVTSYILKTLMKYKQHTYV